MKWGTRVEVRYTGTLTRDTADRHWVADPDGIWHSYEKGGKVSVTPAPPENWPPEPGDTWAVEDVIYHVRQLDDGLAIEPVRRDASAYFAAYTKEAESFRLLNPRLLFRPGESK